MANTTTVDRTSPTTEDPVAAFNFQLEVQGMVAGFFTEISGIGSEHEIIEHKAMTATGQEVVKKIPGRLKWNDITLKRGITTNMDIWTWRKSVETGGILNARYNGTISMFAQDGALVAQWNFINAWPSKVSGPAPKADGNEVGMEECTLVCEYIERVSV
jgi:phage tail-like protein